MLQTSLPVKRHILSQDPAPSISEDSSRVSCNGASEYEHRRSKFHANRLGPPSSESQKSISGGCQQKPQHQHPSRDAISNRRSQSTKEPRLPLKTNRLPPHKTKPAPRQQELTQAEMVLHRSAHAALPKAIDVDCVEYIKGALNQCIAHNLLMPNPIQSYIPTRLYR